MRNKHSNGAIGVRYLLIGAVTLVMIIITAIVFPPRRKELFPGFNSYKILDRNGNVLREVLSKDYRTSTWISLADISPHLVKATIIREDRRFFLHPGVDILALGRALFNNLRYRHITSGGSTITMQVAKFCIGLSDRSIITKIREILYALKLELYLKKSEILEIYLNRAPYSNLLYGVESASRFYFHKKSGDISLGESSILAAIPKAPSLFNPYFRPYLVLSEKEKILSELLRTGSINELAFKMAIRESINVVSADNNFEAPHFVDMIIENTKKQPDVECLNITTTLDLKIQKKISKITSTSINALSEYRVNQGSVVVMERTSGDIIAMTGSVDYFDPENGQVNGALSLRQPGSSIKPFLYLLALESGCSVNAILPDTIWEFKLPDKTVFAPRNYGNKYHGPTRAREALGSSFNVPTVYLLEKIGYSRFYCFLKDLNFRSLERNASFYGLSLGLGGGEVTLLEMTNAYRSLARGGFVSDPRTVLSIRTASSVSIPATAEERKLFSPAASYIITDVLSDNASRIKAFGDDSPLNLPFPCAVKTGTTKDYRDNWCVGYTTDYIVGVWVGNFDAASMQGVSGVSGAAPLFRDIMIELHRNSYPKPFPEPPDLITARICGKSGLVSTEECPVKIDELFMPGTDPRDACPVCRDTAGVRSVVYFAPREQLNADRSFTIVNPRSDDIYKINPQVSSRTMGIKFLVAAGEDLGDLDFILDGKALSKVKYPYSYLWSPVSGEHTLEVSGGGKSDLVRFRVF